MLISVQHTKTTTKDAVATYSYTIIDSVLGEHKVSFSMPLSMVVLTNRLATIALQLAYAKQGREALKGALNAYYAALQREGYDAKKQRTQDHLFYWRALRYFTNAPYDPLTKTNPKSTICIRTVDKEWDGAYENWLKGKPPTNSPEWKKGVYLGSGLNG